MFFLKDLPTDRNLSEFTHRYPNINPSAIKTCAELLRTGSELLSAFETMLGSCGFSLGRFLTLIVMNRTPDEEINPSTLAQKLGVARATMTGLLRGLEKEGLIERRSHAEDARKIGVRLTGKGRGILDALLPDYYRHIAKLMTYLTEGERQSLVTLLKKVNQGLFSLNQEQNSEYS